MGASSSLVVPSRDLSVRMVVGGNVKMRRLAGILVTGVVAGLAYSAVAVTADVEWSNHFTYSGQRDGFAEDEYAEKHISPGVSTQSGEEDAQSIVGALVKDSTDSLENFAAGAADGLRHIGLVSRFSQDSFVSENFGVGTPLAGFPGQVDKFVIDGLVQFDTSLDRHAMWNEDRVLPHLTKEPGGSPRQKDSKRSGLLHSAPADPNTFGPHNCLDTCLAVSNVFGAYPSVGSEGDSPQRTMIQCGDACVQVDSGTPFPPVPEPSTFALLGLGVLGVGLRRKFAA